MLLANSGIDNSHRVSFLGAASPRSSSETTTTDEYLDSISYNTVASVLRQCDQMKSQTNTNALSASSATTRYGNNRYKAGDNPCKRLTPDQLADLKSRSKCCLCQKWGHCQSYHNPDGSIQPGNRTTDTASASSFKTQNTSNSFPKKTVTFNMVHCTYDNDTEINADLSGPLLDDGAPYSGLGLYKFRVLQPILLPGWS